MKDIKIGKEEIKLSLFTDNMISYINSKPHLSQKQREELSLIQQATNESKRQAFNHFTVMV